ncbi:MAG: hypothetical protein ACLFUI_10490 [Halanaerobiales bacterium]
MSKRLKIILYKRKLIEDDETGNRKIDNNTMEVIKLTNNRQKNYDDEIVFSYRVTKDDKVFIYWYEKQVTVLKGNKARKFIFQIKGSSFEEEQLLMARVTGNFKHGNER